MTSHPLPERDAAGNLPSHAWPGGYPIYYLDKQGNVLCAKCASRDIDDAAAVVAADINWESDLECDDCDEEIERAYEATAEEE